MYVSHVRVAADEIRFFLEVSHPVEFNSLLQSSGFAAPDSWDRIPASFLKHVPLSDASIVELCLYSYGRGFRRGMGADDWDYGPVPVIHRSAGGSRYEQAKLSLFAKLRVHTEKETPLAYLLAELRVRGERHARELVAQPV